MARPGERALEYQRRAEGLSWKAIRSLSEAVKRGDTPGWEEGKALEYLIVRAFRLSGAKEAEYPYDVPPAGNPIEQIDGLVPLDGHTFLVECKDRDAVDVEAIAKLRNQLLRRPETTLGCVFAAGRFTAPALVVVDFSVPHRILLWSEIDIEDSIKQRDFVSTLRAKYHILCKYGLTDHSPHFREVEA